MDAPPAPALLKWSFSTLGPAVLVFFLAAFAASGLCASAAAKRRRNQSEEKEKEVTAQDATRETATGWGEMLGSMDWSDASLHAVEQQEKEARVASAMNTLPLWQRRILMGERCEMPKFSGLILYDERGRPLKGNSSIKATSHQEKPAAPVTTLKDLL